MLGLQFTLGKFIRSRLLSYLIEYLVVDNGAYLCTNSPRGLISAWRDASKRMVAQHHEGI